MRALSDWMKNAEAKATMLRLADDYDNLADRAAARANSRPKRQPALAGDYAYPAAKSSLPAS